ncbi:YpzI family protein [Bacillus sp. SCS-151]
MGKDRQEKKLQKKKQTESDRDQALHYRGATELESPSQARVRNGQEQ